MHPMADGEQGTGDWKVGDRGIPGAWCTGRCGTSLMDKAATDRIAILA